MLTNLAKQHTMFEHSTGCRLPEGVATSVDFVMEILAKWKQQ